MMNISLRSNDLAEDPTGLAWLQFILFGLRYNLAVHPERSPLDHSYGYAPAGDRPSCFASLTLSSNPPRNMRVNSIFVNRDE